jgi:hypothetical protein
MKVRKKVEAVSNNTGTEAQRPFYRCTTHGIINPMTLQD